ncbi:glutathione-dependent formaldehyde dehydrogenase, partial [Pseudomonas aeruginosa]|nr:glutathione-dependent formaldehyde dehydrogenase [Pseudomonas aeruginosa]
EHIGNGDLHPEAIISHRLRLDDAPEGYALFDEKREDCRKVVLRP